MSWQLAENHEISEVRKAYGQTLEQMILNGRPIMVCDADLAGSSGAGYLYDKYAPMSIPLHPLYPDELRIRYVSLLHSPSRIFTFMHQIPVTGRCTMGQHIPPLRILL